MADLYPKINSPAKEDSGVFVCKKTVSQPYKLLIFSVDDTIRHITKKALKNYTYQDRPVTVLNCMSTEDAKDLIRSYAEIAIVLIHLDKKTKQSGLALIRWMKRTLRENRIRIIVHSFGTDHLPGLKDVENLPIDHCFIDSGLDKSRLILMITLAMQAFFKNKKIYDKCNGCRRIESNLKVKKAILKDVIANIGDILWEVNQKLEFVYVSKKAEDLTGFAWKDFIGKHLSFFMTKESKVDVWPQLFQKIKDRKAFSNIDVSRKTKTGETLFFLTSGNPVYGEDNRFKGYRGADINITDLKLAQIEKEKLMTRLRNAQRLEAIGTLAGGIAHDFNNILGGILGYAQLLQFELKNVPAQLPYVQQIVSSCDRAKNLIIQILDFSRQREESIPNEIINPIEIVRETTQLLKASFPSSIVVETLIDPDTGYIQADSSQIHQAVLNLCTNARQAIESGIGKISISVNEFKYSTVHPIPDLTVDLPFGEYIRISVSDTGKGIDPDSLSKIFNPYFTTKEKGDGTGLGLAVVHGIVTRFNGAVTTQTIPGNGAVFTLYFPKYTAKERQQPSLNNQLIPGEARILFIDDEPILVEVGRQMLKKLGYKAVALASPIQALNYIKKNPHLFDLVITDMTMPDLFGTQLAVKIKKIRPDIPVILATGFVNINQSERPTPESIDAILPKPVEIKTLSRAITKVLHDPTR